MGNRKWQKMGKQNDNIVMMRRDELWSFGSCVEYFNRLDQTRTSYSLTVTCTRFIHLFEKFPTEISPKGYVTKCLKMVNILLCSLVVQFQSPILC